MKPLKCNCIRCGDADIALNLATVGQTGAANFHCNQCGEDFSIDDVRKVMLKWSTVLTWIEIFPREAPVAS